MRLSRLDQAVPRLTAATLILASAAAAAAEPPDLVFSVKRWQGEYESRDIPGGVESTPAVGSIHSIRADGSDLKKVAELGRSTDFPMFSPDGRWIYFQSKSVGHSRIYRCRPDGGDVTMIADPSVIGPEWKEAYGYTLSRDDSQMLYVIHDGTSGRLVRAAADGARPQLVAPELGYLYMAAFDPAGTAIVCSGPARGYRLKLIRLADGSSADLTPKHPESFVPQFFPDGKSILFIRRDGDIYRVDATGGNLQRLTQGNGYVEFRLSAADRHGSTDGPRISPNGKEIAYIAIKEGIANVCVMNADGTDQRQTTHRREPCGRVRWSPDGNRLAFVSFDGKFPQLFVVDAVGGEPRQLTHLDGAVSFLEWRPK